jgi:hypothetical protein
VNIKRGRVEQRDRRRKPILRIAICSFIALLFTWQIATRQLSKVILQTHSPAAALRADPHSGLALTAMAATELGDNHIARSSDFAVRALRSTVLSPVALRSLMIADQLSGKGARSRSLAMAAAKLGSRDEPTLVALFALDVQSGRMADAADRLDAIARTSDQPSVVFPIIDSWLQSNDFKREIVARLSRNPHWRRSYLTTLSELDPPSVMARLQLATALSHNSREQLQAELTPYAFWLLDHGYFAGGYSYWRNHLAEKALLENGLLYDGGFRAAGAQETNFPFQWNLRASAEALAAPAQKDGEAGLNVATDGTVDSNLVQQKVVLPPGKYQFAVDMVPVSKTTLDAFQWKVTCEPQHDPVPVVYFKANTDERQQRRARIGFFFDVPDTKCPYQSINLQLSRTPVPEDIEAFFTNAKIQ